MRKTEVWKHFDDREQTVIKTALRAAPRTRSPEQWLLLRKYWRMQQRRCREKASMLDNHTINKEYHEWLEYKSRPTKPFNRRWYDEWKRGEE